MSYKDPEKRKKYRREYYENNKAALLKYQEEYRKTHATEIKIKQKNQYVIKKTQLINYHTNKDAYKKRAKGYYQTNNERLKEYSRNYYNSHKHQIAVSKKIYDKSYSTRKKELRNKNAIHIKQQAQEYRKTQKGKQSAKISKCRRRGFQFTPINTYAEGCEAHHLDYLNVIYIPTSVHKHINHKQQDIESMNRINIIAWSYLEGSVL